MPLREQRILKDKGVPPASGPPPKRKAILNVAPAGPEHYPTRMDEAGQRFDIAVARIQAGEFSVTAPLDATICRECDLRALCRAEGIIGGIGESEALAA